MLESVFELSTPNTRLILLTERFPEKVEDVNSLPLLKCDLITRLDETRPPPSDSLGPRCLLTPTLLPEVKNKGHKITKGFLPEEKNMTRTEGGL